MTDSVEQTPARVTRRQREAAASVFIDIADTTWRLFVPTVGLLLLGRWLDVRYSTKPWLMLGGALVGSIIAGFLIKRQLARSSN